MMETISETLDTNSIFNWMMNCVYLLHVAAMKALNSTKFSILSIAQNHVNTFQAVHDIIFR
jgi:hypothetical protein